MPKIRNVELTVSIKLPQWVDSADLDVLERELAAATASVVHCHRQSVRADIKTLEAL